MAFGIVFTSISPRCVPSRWFFCPIVWHFVKRWLLWIGRNTNANDIKQWEHRSPLARNFAQIWTHGSERIWLGFDIATEHTMEGECLRQPIWSGLANKATKCDQRTLLVRSIDGLMATRGGQMFAPARQLRMLSNRVSIVREWLHWRAKLQVRATSQLCFPFR